MYIGGVWSCLEVGRFWMHEKVVGGYFTCRSQHGVQRTGLLERVT
jgi:hypothetical protein